MVSSKGRTAGASTRKSRANLTVVGGSQPEEASPKRGSKKNQPAPAPAPDPVVQTTVENQQQPAPAGIGHNDEERVAKAKFFRDCREYEALLAKKKESDANLRNFGKRIKDNGGSVDLIKLSIKLRSGDDDEVGDFQKQMDDMLRVARWNGLPMFSQGNLFDEDRRPIDERAFDEGERAGMSGDNPKPPPKYGIETPAGQKWMEGWHAGQRVLLDKFAATATLLRPQPDERQKEQDVVDDMISGDTGGDYGAGDEVEAGDGGELGVEDQGDGGEQGGESAAEPGEEEEDVRPAFLRDRESERQTEA